MNKIVANVNKLSLEHVLHTTTMRLCGLINNLIIVINTSQFSCKPIKALFNLIN